MFAFRPVRALPHAILACAALACVGGAAIGVGGAAIGIGIGAAATGDGAAAEGASRGVHRVPLRAVTQDEGAPLELYTESHALLIGASRYSAWPVLPSVAEELDAVEEALADTGFSVERLVDPDARALVDGIRSFIDEHGYDPENRLLFYFSGHGHSVGDKGFLLPVDVPLPGERREFRRRALPMTQVLAWARDMEAKHVLFVFDSCFAGSVFSSKGVPEVPEDRERYVRKATALPVRQFLTAGSANEEVPAKSTFTPAFVSAIRDARALVDGIRSFIDEHGYDPENRLLFYFSGHGHSVGDKGFLLPVDVPLPGERREFRRRALPMTQVLAWARDMEAKHVLFVFDSCFAGSVFSSKGVPEVPEDRERYVRKATALPVRQFLTAGSANEEVPAKSTFTPAFVSAIRGEGDLNRDGYVTGSELGVHLSQLVPRFVDQTPQYGKIRDYDLSRGDFVFFTGEAQPERGAGSPPPAAVAGPIVDERLYSELPDSAVEVMVWQAAERGDSLGEYEAYLERYPEGLFASIARARARNLAEAPGAVGSSPDVPPATFFEPEMVGVPGGSFVMGSDEGRDNERPTQLVTVEPFEIGKYEVTFEEFDRFTLANGLRNVDDNGWGRGSRPVINVSWHLAREYTRWLSSVTGRRYRLPVEAEWEYVARAASGTRFVSGDDPAGLCAHSNLSYKTDACEDRFEFTAPVGDFEANPWGLHDLFGNVWEWTEDCWHPDHTGLPLDGRTRTRGGDCDQRVVRGGAWYSEVDQLRSSYRNRNKAASGSDSVGFRVVRAPDDLAETRR